MRKSAHGAGDRLISGKLRRKDARAGASHRTVTVDGTDYAWSCRHGWAVRGRGQKAISVSVALHPGRNRELILDVAIRVADENAPAPEQRLPQLLVEGIRAAREAGWDPESRGRAFRYGVEDPS